MAAAMIASRRSAARSARFGLASGSFGETTLVSLARAALLTARRRAGMGWRVLVRFFVILHI
jgi:hypothetical protein